MTDTEGLTALDAATRLLGRGLGYCLPVKGGPDNGGGFVTGSGDVRRLAKAYLAEHSTELIDIAALQRLGFRYDGGGEWSNRYIILCGGDNEWGVRITGGRSTVYLGGLGQIVTTVGQLECLMRGLGIEVPT